MQGAISASGTVVTCAICLSMQLGLAGKGTVLGLRETWNAVVGGKMGHRVLLVGVAPRVCALCPTDSAAFPDQRLHLL